MKTKQLKWPKWTEQYEDIKEDSKTIRILTRPERTWGRLDHTHVGALPRTRTVRRTLRKIGVIG